MQLVIETLRDSRECTLKLAGVLDISTVETFKRNLEGLDEFKKITIDFGLIKFVDSTGLGGIAFALKRCQQNKVAVRIVNISPEVYEVLEITGFPEIFGEHVFMVQRGR